MSSRVRGIEGRRAIRSDAWQVCATEPGAAADPAGLERLAVDWVESTGGTAAETMRAAGLWSLDGPARRFDAEDWWYRAELPSLDGDELVLCFDGLATVADAWVDGEHLLSSESMFLAHERPLPRGSRVLHLRFRALDPLLATKRPRPRWRAPLVEHQQLRWFRTTLLGRTPGWSPPAAPVGPWRPVRVEARVGFAVDGLRLRASLDGERGLLEVVARLRTLRAEPRVVEIVVERNGESYRATLERTGDGFTGALVVPRVERWWPHTHGEPALYGARLRVDGVAVDLGPAGFRTIERDGDFGLKVNGVPVFCRGACWAPPDPVSLDAGREAYARTLGLARDAGMNMVRVPGTMVYETDDFYDLCDELGLLVWQDLMFANMDYPADDPGFARLVETEVRQQLERFQARPCIAVICGNSEVDQQAALWGAPRDLWAPKLFHETLQALAGELLSDVPYWPSSAHGGGFPHQADVGTTSYYGVGAYLAPLEDARRAEVRFATECLAFANVPEPRAIPGGVRAHSPEWKARTPRDLGAGWDFDDVRDHYLSRLFDLDPVALRRSDHDRYLELGRVVTGEVMAAVFGEWRRVRSKCRGALVWLLRDLWSGAGWGVLDASGAPKAAYFYLRRALQPVAIHLSDEGVNGLAVHVINDRAVELRGEVRLEAFRGDARVVAARHAIDVSPHGAVEVSAASMLDRFHDLSYAYRFGPPPHDVVVATLVAEGVEAAEAFHFPLGLAMSRERGETLEAEARPGNDGDVEIVVRARRFAQSIAIEAGGYEPDDAYFHLAPGGERRVRLRLVEARARASRCALRPLNAEAATWVELP